MKSRVVRLTQNLVFIGLATTALACSQSSSNNAGSGGSPGSGGSGHGGSSATGAGGQGTGGASGTGGATGTGGAKGSGGAPGTGGLTGTAGNSVGAGGSNLAGAKGSGGAAGAGNGGADASSGLGGMTGHDAGPALDSGTTGNGGAAGGAGGAGGGAGSPGACPTAVLKSGDSNKTLTVDSLSRKYILHVPSGYTGDKAVPLVLDFHPIGGSASEWRSGSPYPAVIDKESVISAFPDGLTGPMGQAWNVEGCCVSKVNGADVDDVAFAKAIVADIEKVACIDSKRIYAVGFSMGGGMSNYLACHAADVFAAAGPASFDLTQQNEGDCKPARPITVIEWRGKNDTVVPYAGGHSALVSGMAIDFLGAVGTFQKWASLDACTGDPSAADSNGCQTYSQCSASVQVTLCTDASGGHEAANAGIVWPMLKKYTMP